MSLNHLQLFEKLGQTCVSFIIAISSLQPVQNFCRTGPEKYWPTSKKIFLALLFHKNSENIENAAGRFDPGSSSTVRAKLPVELYGFFVHYWPLKHIYFFGPQAHARWASIQARPWLFRQLFISFHIIFTLYAKSFFDSVMIFQDLNDILVCIYICELFLNYWVIYLFLFFLQKKPKKRGGNETDVIGSIAPFRFYSTNVIVWILVLSFASLLSSVTLFSGAMFSCF